MGRSSSKQGIKLREGMEANKFEKSSRKQDPHLSGGYIRSLVKQLTTSSRTKDPSPMNTTTGTDPEGGVDGSDGFSVQNPTKQQPVSSPQQHKKQARRRLHTSRPYQERPLNMAEARREIVTALKFHRAAMKQQKQPQISYSALSCPSPDPLISWPSTSSIAPPLSVVENVNLALPNQPLGLNLNIHDFNNLDVSPSSSSSPVLGLHPAMDEEEMAAIRLIGEQHDMEWGDRMNLVKSTWWFKFLKSMEIGSEVKSSAEDDGFNSPFDQVMEIPSWLINANEGCFLQENFNDLSSNEYLHDPALPCMEIEEIEGMDGEWLD